MSERVALTGATGFIGQALLSALSSSGTRVRALTRKPAIERARVEWVKGDLHTQSSLDTLVDGCSTVIHCAGAVRGNSQEQFDLVNVSGTLNLLNALDKTRSTARLLLISSLAAREPGISWYAQSKFRAETLLKARENLVEATVFRPTAVYGPGDREIKPLLQLMRAGILPVPNIDTRFSLIHIDDLVTAVMKWTALAENGSSTFELDDGSPNGYNWDTLIELGNQVWGKSIIKIPIPRALLELIAGANLRVSKLLNYQPMFTPGKVQEIAYPDWICDNTPAMETLGWKPAIRLVDAMNNPDLLQL